jgi:hypothetical protein
LAREQEDLPGESAATHKPRPALDLAAALDLLDEDEEELTSPPPPPLLLSTESVDLALAPHRQSWPHSAHSGTTSQDSRWSAQFAKRSNGRLADEDDAPNSDAFLLASPRDRGDEGVGEREDQEVDSLEGRRSPGDAPTRQKLEKVDLDADAVVLRSAVAAETTANREEVLRWMSAVGVGVPVSPAGGGPALDLSDGTLLHRLIAALERSGPLSGFTSQPRTTGQRVQNIRRCLEHLAQHVRRIPLTALSCEEELGRNDQDAAFALVAAIRKAYVLQRAQ